MIRRGRTRLNSIESQPTEVVGVVIFVVVVIDFFVIDVVVVDPKTLLYKWVKIGFAYIVAAVFVLGVLVHIVALVNQKKNIPLMFSQD